MSVVSPRCALSRKFETIMVFSPLIYNKDEFSDRLCFILIQYLFFRGVLKQIFEQCARWCFVHQNYWNDCVKKNCKKICFWGSGGHNKNCTFWPPAQCGDAAKKIKKNFRFHVLLWGTIETITIFFIKKNPECDAPFN